MWRVSVLHQRLPTAAVPGTSTSTVPAVVLAGWYLVHGTLVPGTRASCCNFAQTKDLAFFIQD